MPKFYFCGQNNFDQFENENSNGRFKEIKFDVDFKDLDVTAFYSAIVWKNQLKINLKNFDFQNQILKISCNNKFCLILLENSDIFQYSLFDDSIEKLNFVNTESENNGKIDHIACNDGFCVAISNKGVVYNIPNKTFEFPKHIRIKKIVCGIEHCLLLTTNGDLYSWGTGLRGQLGHGEIISEEVPKLIEALAGIKIIDISANGWHSAAISAFGDLYTWGWNSFGQLGIAVYDDKKKRTTSTIRPKNPAVYPSPQLIDFEDEINIKNVSCGSKHTIIKTESNEIYASGWNKYGQLGLDKNKITFQYGNIDSEVFIDKFIKIEHDISFDDCIIKCGYMSSIIIKK